ncbi:NACHT domain-containing protein [Saccharopolyspora taberi]|uniref:NACHT domain-containing protein n=1 Tax=Saccharopolyspora taberi TaxID=60895 RepID=UPI0031D98BA8
MADGHEIHNEFHGQAKTSFQFGPNYGHISVNSPSSLSVINERQAEHLRDLAGLVRSASERELEKWGLRGRDALPVRWHTAADDLFDHWTKIQGDGAPVSLDGEFTEIRETYETVESRRLVILGRAGSGKTVLAHRFILDLVRHNPTGPVPVLFSLSDWNPITEFRSWLIEHIIRDFAFLDTPDTSGKKMAEVFVRRDLILPVLDGFDEIPKQHRSKAIRQISSVDLPLILTSRPDEYARAVHEIRAVGGAAAIVLEDLPLDESHAYLRQSTGKPCGYVWDVVFEHLRTAPDDLASRNLTTVLTSPLMVVLARTVYNDNSGHQPGELLDTEQFPTAEDIEDRLLHRYLNTAYTHDAQRPHWSSDQARRWLGYLATHLTRRNSHDFAWWRLPATLHRHIRILATVVALGTTVALTAGVAYGIVYWIIYGFANAFIDAISIGIASGIAAGVVVGGINELRLLSERGGQEPERLRLGSWQRSHSQRSFSTRFKKVTSVFAKGLALGLALGLGLGFSFELVSNLSGIFGLPVHGGTLMLMEEIMFGVILDFMYNPVANSIIEINGDSRLSIGLTAYEVAFALTFGITLSLAFGLVNVIVSTLGDTLDPRATEPWKLLATDRQVALVQMVATVLAVWLAFGLANLAWIPYALIGGMLRLALTAWGSWLLFARLWLPLTGRLPWRPKRFLEDAYDRGVLRRAGAVYQFRHARLRDHLARQAQEQSAAT